MANKKKLDLASTQANKLIAGLPERRENIKAQVQFRTEISEFQKRANYQTEFDRSQGAKRMTGLHPNCKISNERTSTKSQTLNGEPAHAMYEAKFQFSIIYRTWNLTKNKNIVIIKNWETNPVNYLMTKLKKQE